MQKPKLKNHRIPYDFLPQIGKTVDPRNFGHLAQNQKTLLNAISDWFQTIANYMHLDSQVNEKDLKSIEGNLQSIEGKINDIKDMFLNLTSNNITSNIVSNYTNNITNFSNQKNPIITHFFSKDFLIKNKNVFKSEEYDDGLNCNCHCPKNGEVLNIFYGIAIGMILFFTILNFGLNVYSSCIKNKKPKSIEGFDLEYIIEEKKRFVRKS